MLPHPHAPQQASHFERWVTLGNKKNKLHWFASAFRRVSEVEERAASNRFHRQSQREFLARASARNVWQMLEMNSNEVAPEKQLISFSTSNCLLSIINNAYLFSFSERGLKSFSFSRSALFFPPSPSPPFFPLCVRLPACWYGESDDRRCLGCRRRLSRRKPYKSSDAVCFAAQHILSCAGFIAAVGCGNAFEALSHDDLAAFKSCFADHQKSEFGRWSEECEFAGWRAFVAWVLKAQPCASSTSACWRWRFCADPVASYHDLPGELEAAGECFVPAGVKKTCCDWPTTLLRRNSCVWAERWCDSKLNYQVRCHGGLVNLEDLNDWSIWKIIQVSHKSNNQTLIRLNRYSLKRPVYAGATAVPDDVKANVIHTMTTLDSFLSRSLWFAGDNVTLADLSILPNVAQIQVIKANCWTICISFFKEAFRRYFRETFIRALSAGLRLHVAARKFVKLAQAL